MTTIAFTGTRKGLTDAQSDALLRVLYTSNPATFDVALHGGAVGADETFHDLVNYSWESWPTIIEVYPADEDRFVYWSSDKEPPIGKICRVHVAAPSLGRNRAMVRLCDHLVACPAEAEEILRSGTWSTVRYAHIAGKPITLILPNGEVRDGR